MQLTYMFLSYIAIFYFLGFALLMLLVSVISCFLASFGLQHISQTFDDRCLLGAKLKFSPISSDTIVDDDHPALLLRRELYEEERIIIDDDNIYPVDQINYMKNNNLDERSTDWGTRFTCEFSIFLPVFQCCFSVICFVMFIICGKGGKSKSNLTFLPEPWRIVVPAFVFFTVMASFSAIHVEVVTRGFAGFCEGFKENMPDIDCTILMNHFRIDRDTLIMPAFDFTLLTICCWIMLLCWLVLFLTMLLRILFCVDFSLIKVTIKRYDDDSLYVNNGSDSQCESGKAADSMITDS
jgi:hypothetical protein